MGMIIPKKTAAMTANYYFSKGSLPKTVAVSGDLLSSTIAVNVIDESGAVLALYDEYGIAVVMTATSQPLTIDSPIWLQFVKGVTTNAVGVQLVD